MLTAVLFLGLLALTSAFFHSSVLTRSRTSARPALSMLEIKADGKVISVAEKTVNLRKVLQANKVEVYPLKAKLLGNCGGAGICGTCAVQILEGEKNLNPPSKNEQNTLRGKPASYRLSCCARVNGNISCKTKVN